jgi:DNA repair exonuclease SbcCD ATPase subunit
MRNLTFKYAAAWNFLPFGPEGIELHFDHYGNIVLIRGENRDAKQIDPTLPSDEFKISSNGTGKSSLQEIIVYGLFGRTVKRPEKVEKDDVVHNLVKKDCKIELVFDKYRIVRTRCDGGNPKKNSLRFWESDKGIWDKDSEITVGDQRVTQKDIEKKIGLSYDAFVNMCIFTDDQRACFLECENGKKKEIVENLLSLGDYRDWHENAKELRKAIKKDIDSKAKEYQLLLGNKDDAERRLALTEKKQQDWKTTKRNEIIALTRAIAAKAEELTITDTGAALLAYQEAQTKIKEINGKLPNLETAKETLEGNLKLAKDKEAT